MCHRNRGAKHVTASDRVPPPGHLPPITSPTITRVVRPMRPFPHPHPSPNPPTTAKPANNRQTRQQTQEWKTVVYYSCTPVSGPHYLTCHGDEPASHLSWVTRSGQKKSTDPPPRLLHCRSAAVANVSLLVDLMKHTLRDLCDLHAEAAHFVVQDGTQPPIP